MYRHRQIINLKVDQWESSRHKHRRKIPDSLVCLNIKEEQALHLSLNPGCGLLMPCLLPLLGSKTSLIYKLICNDEQKTPIFPNENFDRLNFHF